MSICSWLCCKMLALEENGLRVHNLLVFFFFLTTTSGSTMISKIKAPVDADCNSTQPSIFKQCYVIKDGQCRGCWYSGVRLPKTRVWDCSLRFQLYKSCKMNRRWNTQIFQKKITMIIMIVRHIRLDYKLTELTYLKKGHVAQKGGWSNHANRVTKKAHSIHHNSFHRKRRLSQIYY